MAAINIKRKFGLEDSEDIDFNTIKDCRKFLKFKIISILIFLLIKLM